MTEIEMCKRDIQTKQDTINREWRSMAEDPNLRGEKRLQKLQAINGDIEDLKQLIRRLNELTEPPG